MDDRQSHASPERAEMLKPFGLRAALIGLVGEEVNC